MSSAPARVPVYTMAGSASSLRRHSASRARFSCAAGRATVKEMLGRSKPVATRRGSFSLSRFSTSAATRGVAVAVEATSEPAPSARAASARRK